MFNNFQTKPKFKQEVLRQVVIADIAKRIELRECKQNFTLEKLLNCRKGFQTYIKAYGEDGPVQTPFSFINSIGNGVASYTHYIRTNQPYAKSVLQYIDEAKSNNKVHEAVAVNDALKKIKLIHNKMVNKRILGEVRSNIEDTLRIFHYDLDNIIFEQQKQKNAQILEYIGELDDGVRIFTPTWLK